MPLKLDGFVITRALFTGCFAFSDRALETLWVAHVSREAHFQRLSGHFGNEWGVDFPIHAVVSDVGMHGSAGLLLAHNHPSGDPTPSEADRRATRRLACALEALNCAVIDHLVFAGTRCVSFREQGLL